MLLTCGHCLSCVLAGALLLGDAFNMRHPLTGGGMTVALSDTRLLCEMLQPLPNFEDSIATARSTAEFYTKRKPVSATINTLANALYKVRQAKGCCAFCLFTLCAHALQQKPCEQRHNYTR
jgi:2-polyprenyl-6-methoxyphenol hydroxylase-like FAD-dependent oxidoreductase